MAEEPPDDILSSPQAMGCMIGIVLLPVFFGFLYFNEPARGSLVFGLLASFLMVLYQRRPVRAQSRTFVVVSLLFLAQLIAALLITLPEWEFSKALLWAIIVPTFALNYGIIFLAERIFGTMSKQR